MIIESILQKLISIESKSGNEDAIQKYIFENIESSGFKPEYVDRNVVVKIKGKNSKHGLIFNSHVDTVEAGDLKQWKYNPFKGVISKGKIYGLGSSDEKASIAVSLELIKNCSKIIPNCDLWFTFVVNEEIDGSGTSNFIKWFKKEHLKKYAKLAGILGEPTDLNKIEIGHKGNVFIKITVNGDSGHGSQPEKIKNHSIKKILQIINLIDKQNNIWSKKYKNDFLGIPTISLTSIIGGDQKSPNKFPDSCIATFDIRTTPEIHKNAIKFISNVVKNYNPQAIIECLYPPASYGYTDPKEEITKIAKRVTGMNTSASLSSNDTCFFTEAKIPAIVFGAGNPDIIHKPNEYCEIKNLNKCVTIYKNIIEQF